MDTVLPANADGEGGNATKKILFQGDNHYGNQQ